MPGGYRLLISTIASEKFFENQVNSTVPLQTIEEAEDVVAKAEKDSFIAVGMCAFGGMACGASFVTPLNWFVVIPSCGTGMLACYDSSLKMREWWKAKEKLYQLKKAEIEAKEAEASSGGSDPSSVANTGGNGPGLFDPILSSPQEPKLPEGVVISIDCPDGGC